MKLPDGVTINIGVKEYRGEIPDDLMTPELKATLADAPAPASAPRVSEARGEKA